jgi:hypothetical protein
MHRRVATMSERRAHDSNKLPYREAVRLVKYPDQDAYERGEPEEVVERVTWYEADGTEITDPERIAELEEKLERKEE